MLLFLEALLNLYRKDLCFCNPVRNGHHILNTDVVDTSLVVAGSARGHTKRRSAFLQIFGLTPRQFRNVLQDSGYLPNYIQNFIHPAIQHIYCLLGQHHMNFLPYSQTSQSFRLIILVEETI